MPEQEIPAEALDPAQLIVSPTAAAIMAAAQPQLGALAMPQPVASPSSLPSPVAGIPVSLPAGKCYSILKKWQGVGKFSCAPSVI